MLRKSKASESGHGPAKGSQRRSFGRIRRERSGRYSAAYVGPDGVLHRAVVTFETRDAAVAWLALERKLIDLESWTPVAERLQVKQAQVQTFAEFAAEWLRARRNGRGEPLKARTVADYQRYLDTDLLPAFGDLPISSLTSARVKAWHEGLDAGTPTKNAHSYQLLRAICSTAVDRNVLKANPCQIQGAGRTVRARKIRTAELNELRVIVDNMPERLRLAVLLGAWCALRYGEIAELRRRDVDVRRGIITVARGVTWPSVKDAETGKLISEATVGTPKSEAGVRDVAIPPHLLPSVAAHLTTHTQPGRDGLLFGSSTGRHIHPRAFGWQYHQARVAAGRPDLRFHDLRHTGAVLAAQAGATLADLMGRLGHSTPSAAMRYQHTAADRDRAIAEALSRMAANHD